MPFTLWRYILRELVVLLVAAAVTLVVVVSFLAAIKPLSEGLLGPGPLLRFVLYTAPTMLSFVLPFAAAFATTLVFLRMAADNEILALSASGFSYVKVLAPPAALGFLLTLLLLYLSNFVVPRFYRQAAATVQADVVQVMMAQLDQGRAFEFDDGRVLFADRAQEKIPPNHPYIERAYQLDGVALGDLDERNRIQSTFTAQRAVALIYRDPISDAAQVKVRLRQPFYYDPIQGQVRQVQQDAIDLPAAVIPNPFEDKPKFFTLAELRRLEREPQRYDRIRELRDELVRALARRRLALDLERSLATGEPAPLRGVSGERYTVEAAGARWRGDELRLVGERGEPVRVRWYAPDAGPGDPPLRTLLARRATARVEPGRFGTQPQVLMELTAARVYAGDVDAARDEGDYAEFHTLPMPRMGPTEPLYEGPDREPRDVWSLAEAARDADIATDEDVVRAQRRLLDKLQGLGLEIEAQQHQRIASAVTCLLLTLLGALLALQLRHRLTLVVYSVSFAPAILTLIMIHTGENIVGSGQYGAGMAVLWLGPVALLGAISWLYGLLRRT